MAMVPLRLLAAVLLQPQSLTSFLMQPLPPAYLSIATHRHLLARRPSHVPRQLQGCTEPPGCLGGPLPWLWCGCACWQQPCAVLSHSPSYSCDLFRLPICPSPPTGIFSPGVPHTFHANYRAALGFLDALEGLCVGRGAVERLRSSAAYAAFLKRWNLSVYFSLLFQDIAGG